MTEDRPREGTRLSWHDYTLFGATVGLIGISFGALSSALGVPAGQAIWLSVLVNTPSSQFAALLAADSGASVAGAAFAALAMATRYTGLGVALMQSVPISRRQGWFASHFLIDAGVAASLERGGTRKERLRVYWLIGGIAYVTWVVGTAVGTMLDERMIDGPAVGLDIAPAVLLIAILAPSFRTLPGFAAGGIGAACTLAVLPFVTVGLAITASGLGALAGVLLQQHGRRPVQPRRGT